MPIGYTVIDNNLYEVRFDDRTNKVWYVFVRPMKGAPVKKSARRS